MRKHCLYPLVAEDLDPREDADLFVTAEGSWEPEQASEWANDLELDVESPADEEEGDWFEEDNYLSAGPEDADDFAEDDDLEYEEEGEFEDEEDEEEDGWLEEDSTDLE